MRRLIVAGALVPSLLVVPATPAAAETTVKPDGNVVTITVSVDVFGAEDLTGPDGTTPLIDYWEGIVNDTWGAAFGKTPYKNCYVFKLKLDLEARSRDADDREGRHRLHVTAPRSGGDWDGVGWNGVPETSRDAGSGYGTRSLEHNRGGTVPANVPPTVVAHEFGHLFGLGDDRADGAPKDGRNGTMMVGGVPGVDVNVVQKMDKNLIDRIGKIIERYLKDQNKKPLSECQSWNGTIDGFGDNVGICDNATVHSGNFTIGVVGRSALLTGNILTEAGTGCGAAGRPENNETDFTLVGEKTRRGFSFTTTPDFPPPVELQIAGDHATGSSTKDPGGNGVWFVTLDYEADCVKNCDEEAVG